MHQAVVRPVEQGVDRGVGPLQGAHLLVVPGIDVVEGHLGGDDQPQMAVLGHGQGAGLVLDDILHQVLGQVVSRAGDVVVAAALAAVDLKGLELAVPLVVLDVEVGEAHKADGLQEAPQLFAQLGLGFGDDHRVVADGVAGVLLQQDVAHAHEAHLPVGAGVVGHHPHKAVVPGDEVLEDQRVLIPCPVDLVDDRVHLLPGLEDVGLLLGGEGVLPVGVRLGGLDHEGAVKGQLELVAHALVVHHRGRVVDAVPVAQLVELLLVDQRLQHVQAHIGGDDVFRVAGQVGGDGVEVVVPAAQHQNLPVGKLTGHLGDVLQHLVHPVVVLPHPVVDDPAPRAHAGGEHTVDDGLYAVGLVKGPGHAVRIDVGAQQNRHKLNCHR